MERGLSHLHTVMSHLHTVMAILSCMRVAADTHASKNTSARVMPITTTRPVNRPYTHSHLQTRHVHTM